MVIRWFPNLHSLGNLLNQIQIIWLKPQIIGPNSNENRIICYNESYQKHYHIHHQEPEHAELELSVNYSGRSATLLSQPTWIEDPIQNLII